MIKLGSKVRDTISGFEGIATGYLTWMYGCNRVCIEPQALHEGKPIDHLWFDEQRVELIEEKAPTVAEGSTATKGGPPGGPSPRSMNP